MIKNLTRLLGVSAATATILLATAGTAHAEGKRFCGFITVQEGFNLGAGTYFKDDDVEYTLYGGCGKARDKAKNSLQKTPVQEGSDIMLWEAYEWIPKDGNKCGKVSDYFMDNGENMCDKQMDKQKPYFIQKISGQNAVFTKQ